MTDAVSGEEGCMSRVIAYMYFIPSDITKSTHRNSASTPLSSAIPIPSQIVQVHNHGSHSTIRSRAGTRLHGHLADDSTLLDIN
jgi:hypothetical protein